jgi:hypothetical protein
MASYRIFFLDPKGRIAAGSQIDESSDDAAIETARERVKLGRDLGFSAMRCGMAPEWHIGN